jgi:very-short-patch-repair endonuclease
MTRGILKHDLARWLRRDQTEVERKLWRALRNRGFAKFKFRRQQPIGPFVVDFVCLETKCVIELDGSQHALPDNALADEMRTAYLTQRGYRVKRYWNHDLNESFEGVLEDIHREMVRGLTR